MTRPDPYGLVVIAGSAGAIGPLRQILSALPADYPLPVVVVQHRSARPRDLLPDLLARGFETLERKLAACGADIERLSS